jgi:hypothetical protein
MIFLRFGFVVRVVLSFEVISDSSGYVCLVVEKSSCPVA